MSRFHYCFDETTGEAHWETAMKGYSILECPSLNKGTAFQEGEVAELGLLGLLPSHSSTMEEQLARTYGSFKSKSTNLEKYIYLLGLQDRNETLFYKLLQEHIQEMMPIVYTPVVGEACQNYSHIYHRPRGLYISYLHRDEISKMLDNIHFSAVEVLVVSDGERILGLGDLGIGGMGIPIGKLTLYTLCAGINPGRTLPIILDVGTDNESLLKDPLYLGWRHKRVRGEDYDNFIESFIQAVKKKFPTLLFQWEDFSKNNAEKLLKRYQDELCSFNDDIQGTGAITLSGLLAACHIKGSRLSEETFFMVGAGSAAKGIVEQALKVMEEEGLTLEEARKKIYLFDSLGLVFDGRERVDEEFKIFYSRPKEELKALGFSGSRISLEEAVEKIHPTVLIGTSAQKGIFNETVVRRVASHAERPIIFPLSNPTSKSEADPKDVMAWTDGKALMGTGSPFPPVEHKGKTIPIGQCNNVFIFPGVGLGVLASGARRVTTSMFVAASKALSEEAPSRKNPQESLFPDLNRVRELARKIALAVAKKAQAEGLAPEISDEELTKKIRAKVWEPRYIPIRRV